MINFIKYLTAYFTKKEVQPQLPAIQNTPEESEEQDEFAEYELMDDILVDGINANGKPEDENAKWIKIEGYPMDDGRIRVEADWTPGLIKYLREHHNFSGTTDEAVVHRLIAVMHEQNIREQQESGTTYE
jgi:hypothetical protein